MATIATKYPVGNTLQNHGDAVTALNSLYEDYLALRELALDMGRLIRRMDESGEHSEFWTMDEDYIIDGRFPR